MSIILSGLTLPNALRWAERYATRLRQSTEETIGGSLHIYQGAASGWEPMTLEGIADSAGITYASLATLTALLEGGGNMTLTLHDSSTHTVRTRVESGRVVEWEPIEAVHDPASSDMARILKINLYRAIQ